MQTLSPASAGNFGAQFFRRQQQFCWQPHYNPIYEASTYRARAFEFSSSIGHLIVKDLIQCKQIER